MKFNQYTNLAMAVFIILISIGVVNSLSTPPFIMAVSENSPSTDVILGIDITSTLEARGYEMGGKYSEIFEDINREEFNGNIILKIFGGEATLIIGEDVSEEGEFVDALKEVLEDLDIDYETTNSKNIEYVASDDYKEQDVIDEEQSNINEPTTTAPITETITRECEIDEDCADNFACTVDTCEEYTCIHVSQEGCQYGTECISTGTIYDNQYCKNNVMNLQKNNGESCMASYECSSGNCKNELCKGKGFFQAIGEWLGRIF